MNERLEIWIRWSDEGVANGKNGKLPLFPMKLFTDGAMNQPRIETHKNEPRSLKLSLNTIQRSTHHACILSVAQNSVKRRNSHSRVHVSSVMSDTDSVSSAGSIVEDASEPDVTSFKCLFCDMELSPVDQMFAHCESKHSFPVREKIKEIGSRTHFQIHVTLPR